MDVQSEKEKLSFWATHFGTDLLCAAWFFLVSSLFYYFVMAYNVSTLNFMATQNIVICNYLCFLLNSIVYTITAILVITISYPKVYRKILDDALVVDVKKMTVVEQYFTGNILLVASWLLLLGTLPLLIYPIWRFVIGDGSVLSGMVYFLTTLLINFFLLICVVACFPVNLVKNISTPGSTIVFDFLADYLCCCFESKVYSCCGIRFFCASHLGRDYQIALWAVFIMSVFGIVGSILFVYARPIALIRWLLLVSWIAFAAGSYLYAIDTYSEKEDSTICFDFLTCSPTKRSSRASREDQIDDSESVPLVPSDNTRSV
jgi:hypothetical protein